MEKAVAIIKLDNLNKDRSVLNLSMERILVDNIKNVVQYKYSNSFEALEMRAEMYKLSNMTFFEQGSPYALCTDKNDNQYALLINSTSQEFRDKYLLIVNI